MNKISANKILIFIAFIIAIIGMVIPITIFNINNDPDGGTYFSNIGDWFGGVAGPLLSFSSFIIVYAALRLQSIDLNEQRLESLKQTKLHSTKRFEESFFYLFSQFNLTIEQLWTIYAIKTERISKNKKGKKIKIKDVSTLESKGRRYFSNVLKRLNDTYSRINKISKKSDSENVMQAYHEVFDVEGANLGLYFSFLQQLLSYIEYTKLIDENEKQFYVNVVKINISEIEKIILHYQILTIQNDEYAELIKLSSKYQLTKGLKERLLINNENKFSPQGWNPKGNLIETNE
jgi:hypothetical protein